MTDNQERELFFTIVLMFTKVLIFAASLLNDLMKILVSLGIFNCVIFKDLGVWLLL